MLGDITTLSVQNYSIDLRYVKFESVMLPLFSFVRTNTYEFAHVKAVPHRQTQLLNAEHITENRISYK